MDDLGQALQRGAHLLRLGPQRHDRGAGMVEGDAQAAVAELHARGIIFTIISSRPPRGLRMLLGPLEITTPLGSFNDGVIATPDVLKIDQKNIEILEHLRGRLTMFAV